MKRKNAFLLGNILMGLGMIMMLVSLAFVLLSEIFGFTQAELLTGSAMMGLFIGALVWLAGARVGGRETVTDKYWWLKNYDERYRRKKHRHP
ncbi:stress-induced protein YchH [Xenorhabdus szentirmaii]|uniref:Inner membrane protein n=2 Tax=Xenorhabdus szentirmaii TaxID=290112 RepID=W1IVQ6_9GAMM|nr:MULTISPECIES: stress-induced protein YchH [Xenorhabdus]MBD2781834.1 stress-induced protein YchH [Xenorhabdus sp. 38]MBD2793090.1 stress-induced protein YchH [Xenorhabdus sp. CUL]MBD2801459.1 stress-induced protein YchH [Xenorhabdus sp. M]MBD2806368.1 stress-induced protein YchH [Xenorhabdus sp. ZM]MBD2820002.1 stress-induced protein YchH [Xenorhabdus sp. 42]